MKAITLFFLLTTLAYSQENIIKVSYQTSLDFGNYKKYKSTLYVNKNESIFLWNKQLNPETEKNDENHITVDLSELDSIGSFNYISFFKDTIYSRIPYFKKEILLLKEKTPTILWEISNETKKIGAYKCQKAKAEFRGRHYTVWFTNEIPVKSGPWKLQGLPGLIIIAYDTTREIQFTFTSISKSNYKINPVLEANRVIDLNEYKKISKYGLQNLLKKFKSKLPRGTTVEVNYVKGMESFDYKE